MMAVVFRNRNCRDGWLTCLTVGTEFESKPTVDIAVLTAREPHLAAIFNYASQAHNNHFFFESLAPEKTKVPEGLGSMIQDNFTRLENFKAEFLATANAMFGSGWVWLVMDEVGHLRILATYNAGTPYGNAYRRQMVDRNTNAVPHADTLGGGYQPPGQMLTLEDVRQLQNKWPIPLLNVAVWEHCWLEDFGVNGKREYLEKWFDSIDWVTVTERHPGMSGTGKRY